jgi:hypothetical protein
MYLKSVLNKESPPKLRAEAASSISAFDSVFDAGASLLYFIRDNKQTEYY